MLFLNEVKNNNYDSVPVVNIEAAVTMSLTVFVFPTCGCCMCVYPC